MKTEKEVKAMLNIIIQDDLPSFFVKFKQFKNVSFGHFPLLSVLYLFEAKKIIKKYEKELINIVNFEVEFEPFEIYKKFKQVSGKSLRLYLQNDFVMPLDMLAILNIDTKVKKYYKLNPSTNLEKIYFYNNQSIKIEENNIKISKKPLKKQQKLFFLLSESVIVLFLCLVSFMFIFSSNVNGSGSVSSPKNIYSVSQLKSISYSNLYFTIENDIEITSNISIDNFSGTIDGKNKTLTLNYNANKSLFNSFSGTIKNLNVCYEVESLTQKDSLGLLINNNSGNIENVNVSVTCNITNTSKNDTSYFSCYTLDNNGTISNCTANVNITSSSNNSYDNFLSVFASNNNGEISNCNVTTSSKLETENIDVCAICINNNANATITNCSNNASILENSNIADFAPLVSGICIKNFGIISYCFNYGELTAVNLANNSANNFIVIGGISSFNHYDITNCINYGNINSNATNMGIYAGGICGYAYNSNNNEDAYILNCGSVNNFNLSNENEYYLFCGAISGFMIGNIKNTFSSCTYTNGLDAENKNFYGLVIGCTYGQQTWFGNVSLYFSFEKVYCVECENTNQVVSAFDYGYGVSAIENLNTNGNHTVLSSFSQLEESEVYWHE